MLIWVSSKIIPLQSREAVNFSLKANREGLGTTASHLQTSASRHNHGGQVSGSWFKDSRDEDLFLSGCHLPKSKARGKTLSLAVSRTNMLMPATGAAPRAAVPSDAHSSGGPDP